jgi:hypothetical protein
MARQMARLQSDLVDILLKMPEPQRRERHSTAPTASSINGDRGQQVCAYLLFS